MVRTAKTEERVEARLRPELLDPSFEGYKLSLDPLATFQTELPEGTTATSRKAGDDQYSLMHAKLFGGWNALVCDPWDADAVYALEATSESILQVVDSTGQGKRPEVEEVWSSPEPSPSPGDYNPSLRFASSELALFADGRGGLYVLKTGLRGQSAPRGRQWTSIFHEGAVCGNRRPFTVRAAFFQTGTLHVLLHYVEEKSKVDSGPAASKISKSRVNHLNVVEWMTLVEPTVTKPNGSSNQTCIPTWQLDRVRRFAFLGSLDYADFDRSVGSGPDASTGFWCLTEKPFHLIYDSSGMEEEDVTLNDPTAAEKSGQKEEEPKDPPPPFYWMQGMEDIVIWVPLPPNTNKREIKVTMPRPSEMTVSVKGDKCFGGKLWNVLEGDSMTWTLQDSGSKLEITVCKADVGLVWQRFLAVPEVDGYLVQDHRAVDNLIKEFKEQEEAEQEQTPASAGGCDEVPAKDVPEPSIFFNEDLEDCDDAPEEASLLYFVTGGGDTASAKASFPGSGGSHQWLCNISTSGVASGSPAPPSRLCLRHDVDGVVWQPYSGTSSTSADTPNKVEHEGTFSAFGYVQASKQQRKFTVAPHNMSYAAVADLNRHIFVYRQVATATHLRNRKSGQNVDKVAKQQVITLESTDEIVGAAATNSTLFVLTNKSVYTTRIATV